ncbi:TIGR04283 family arsenosugar biosynthesis glycosyltransferase [Algirhabdus cladophorae]|uniref:TIGR04283 family arsenosugar biosynthesis glycosyltransferase n=1 Tax=Algirhabdus cladophorae TaxID=3377108 RepID=UPI003B8472A9
MRAPVSIVIPTLNAAEELGPTLMALMEGIEAGLVRELIISDGGSTDATLELADEWGAEVLTGAQGRGAQLALGCEAARGQWLLMLHADTHLPEGWTNIVWNHLDPERAYYGRLAFRSGGLRGRLVAGWANIRSAWFRLPYGDQGLLISKALYLSVRGYPEIPLMEDVALAQKLSKRLRPLPLTVHTSAARYERDGWLRRGTRNLMVLTRYLAGAKPADLVKIYTRR